MKTLRSTPSALMQCMFAWLMVSSVSGQGLPTVEQIYSWPLDPARPSIHNDLVEHPTNGFFYGTSASGGFFSNGLVFRMSAAGETVPLAHFTVTGPLNPGSKPVGRLALGSNGDYYGVTLEGGSSSNGTVFRVGLDGELTTLVHFTSNGGSNKGAKPRDGLVLGPDGHFYGTTSKGGLPIWGRSTVLPRRACSPRWSSSAAMGPRTRGQNHTAASLSAQMVVSTA